MTFRFFFDKHENGGKCVLSCESPEEMVYLIYFKLIRKNMDKSTIRKLLLIVGVTFLSLAILLLCGVDISQKLPWGGVILAGVLCLTGILRNYIKI